MPANFSASLKKLVLLKEDESCSLKRHFSGCIRQVVGYLDLLAKNDADRVVWVKAKNIQKHCKNYGKKKDGKPTAYSMAMIEKALKLLLST
jgi:hypothetical protein